MSEETLRAIIAATGMAGLAIGTALLLAILAYVLTHRSDS